MANANFAFSNWVGLDCLRLLENTLVVGQFGNDDFEKEFNKEFAVGDTINIKEPQRWVVQDGFNYNPQAIDRRTKTVTIDQPCTIGFEWDSFEAALKLERSKAEIRQQYLQPAMAYMSQEIDSRLSRFIYQHTNNVSGTLASTPTSWATYAAAQTRMLENSALMGKSGMIITPQMTETMITNSLTQFNPNDEISKQYKRGYVGEAAGFKWYNSMSLYQHVSGNLNSGTVNLAGQTGTTLNINCTANDFLNEGDIISIAGVNNVNPMTRRSTGRLKQFKVRASTGVIAGTTAAVTISPGIIPSGAYQNCDSSPANLAVITLNPGTTGPNNRTGIFGFAVTKNAFALCGVKLMMPENAEIAIQQQDPETGISIAFIRDFDTILRRRINRFDMLFGFGELYFDSDAVLIASLT